MKYPIITSIALSIILSSSVNAASDSSVNLLNNIYENLEAKTEAARLKYNAAQQNKGTVDPKSFRTQKERTTQLNYAISLRQKNDFNRQYISSLEQKNTIYQKLQHQESRYQKNLPETSTQLSRTGDLEFSPYYQYRRPFSNPSTLRANRKQVSRQRSFDYYVNQGYAGTEALQSNLLRGDEYQVERVKVPVARHAAAQASTIKSIRDEQKAMLGARNENAMGTRKTSRNINTLARKYSNPYQFSFFVE